MWWAECGDVDISLRDFMDGIMGRETIQETAKRLKIKRHDTNNPPGRFPEDAGAD